MGIKVLKEADLNPELPAGVTAGRWYFFCPGCYAWAEANDPGDSEYSKLLTALHVFNEATWQFNGNQLAPTIAPSVLMTTTRLVNGKATPYTCHSFVRNGNIEFLGDCSHPMKNQTLPLIDAQRYLDEDAKQTGG